MHASMKLKSQIKQLRQMWPRARRYGIKYLFNVSYRKKCRNKEKSKRTRKVYGTYFCWNRGKIKNRLLARSRICFWCRQGLSFKEATIDHIIPITQGGDNSLKNLRLIHEMCRRRRDASIQKGILRPST